MPVRHVIEHGESVVALGERYGLAPETIWEHADNAALRERRTDMNVLRAGDVVVIPDKQPRTHRAATDRLHRFRRNGIPALFRLQLFDGERPRANERYELTVDGVTRGGTTDADGVLLEPVPASARRGELVIGADGMRLELRFGDLDPIDTPRGLAQRLANLGYPCDTDADVRESLLAFQRRFLLDATGEADPDTLALLATLADEANDFASAHGERP